MKELPREQLFVQEKKAEVITDSNEARKIMHNFWRREKTPQAIKAELELQESAHMKDLLRLGYEMGALRMSSEELEENRKEPPISSAFIFASQNETKRRIIAEISEKQKMPLQETMFSVGQGEEELEHQILRQLIKEQKLARAPKTVRIYDQAFYALDIAEAKTLKMRETYKNVAILGADLVVLRGSKILEKPKNMDDALEMLKSVSGKKIRISFGSVLLTPTNFGKNVLIKDGGYLDVKLRNFTEKEASEYLYDYGKACLMVAGGIDYASPLAQVLISDRPIEVSVRQPGKSILVSPSILPQLKDYLMGTPKELMEEMLKEAKLLQGKQG